MSFSQKGYLFKLKEQFAEKGFVLIIKTRANRRKEALSAEKSHSLKKSGLIETVFDVLSAACNMEHTRHRIPINFISNCYAALIAYSFMDKQPATQKYQKKPLLNDMHIVLS